MQRSLVLTLAILITVVAASLWWLLGGVTPPPPAPTPPPEVQQDAAPSTVPASADLAPGAGVLTREAVTTVGDPLLDDPDIRAGLCGFRGRVVDFRKAPVPDTA